MTQPKRLSDRLSVTSQVNPASMKALADAGFRSVISNRPDGEEPGQPDWATIEQAASEAGMDARHIPVTTGAIRDADAARLRAALDRKSVVKGKRVSVRVDSGGGRINIK